MNFAGVFEPAGCMLGFATHSLFALDYCVRGATSVHSGVRFIIDEESMGSSQFSDFPNRKGIGHDTKLILISDN